MGTGYSRQAQSNIVDGNVINAADLNNEYNKLSDSFIASTGHTHDGTANEGGPVSKIGPSQNVEVTSSLVKPSTTNALDIGETTFRFKDQFLSGDLTVGDDLKLDSDNSVLSFGADNDVTFTHVPDTAIKINDAIGLQFRDSAISINSSTDGQLDIIADTEIQMAATTVDINGNVDISGSLTVGGSGLSSTELGILVGATINTTELNIIDGNTAATSTTIANADRVVLNDNGTMKQVAVTDLSSYFDDSITTMPNLTSVGTLTQLTVDNVIINGSTIGHTSDADLITVADGIATVAGELSCTTLDIGGTNVSSTAAELNILSNVTVTSSELNVLDGDTSATSTTIEDADRLVLNDNGLMKQVAVTDLAAYFDDEITTMTSLTQIGTLQDVVVDSVKINDAKIGFFISGNASASNEDLLTLSKTQLTVDGTMKASAFNLNNVVIDASGTDINLLNGLSNTVSTAELGHLDGVTSSIQTQLDSKLSASGNLTFSGDILFTGDSANVLFDKSDNALEFADNAKLVLGAGSDLQIYHDASNSIIKDSGTGILQIHTNELNVKNSGNSETMISAVEDGAVELYHGINNSSNAEKKFETTATGVTITGSLTIGSDTLTAPITKLNHVDISSGLTALINSKQSTITGSATTVLSTNLTGNRVLVTDTSESPNGKIAVSSITGTELASLDGVSSNIQTQLDSKQATVTGAATTVVGSNVTASRILISDASGKISAHANAQEDYLDGLNGNIKTLIDAAHDTVSLAADNSSANSHFIPLAATASGDQGLKTDSTFTYIPNTDTLSVGNVAASTIALDTAAGTVATFKISNVIKGSIATSSTGTTYNTISDNRLKENIKTIPNAIERINKLNPCSFTWINNDTTSEGFIAQEVLKDKQLGKDSVNINQNTGMYSMDYGKVTPLLTAALQEALNKIKILEEKINILEKGSK